jgi:cysteine desulfurase / selenocysteine lyase
MTLDVPWLRSDTPGVTNVVHFNNAGAALPPRPVLEAVTGHLAREAAIGGYEAAAEAADRLADVYEAVATLIGASPDEIAVVALLQRRGGGGTLRSGRGGLTLTSSGRGQTHEAAPLSRAGFACERLARPVRSAPRAPTPIRYRVRAAESRPRRRRAATVG